jgi:hypothetical protein
MAKGQKLLSFKELPEEKIEEILESVLKEYTIISMTTVPLFTGVAAGNFLPARLRYVYDVYVVVESWNDDAEEWLIVDRL